ncbi:MAG: DUF1826 domain-containing protein [Cyclobacteriaceae bacterium]|nr:DUF1826 domain-containing protein [Cyclobacteriaceae bacterium]
MLSLNELLPGFQRPSHVLRVDNPAELLAIVKSRYNLVIATREVDEGLEKAVQELMHSSFRGIDTVLQQQEEWREAIAMLIGGETSANWIALEPLVKDVRLCCELFATITRAQTIRLSLKTVNHDACRKFHIDGYAYRLLCSYCGPGTEWTYNDNVRRKYLGEGENEDIIRDWSRIERIGTYDIAVLKGELPHQRTGKGIVHRSPPISLTGEKRLLLRIDYTS